LSSSSSISSSSSALPSSSSLLPSSSSKPPSSSSSIACPSSSSSDEFCDQRDGKVYKFVEIEGVTWMAENLNYEVSGSKCYNDIQQNCNTYGRLYHWEMAMGVCPDGWHLPSQEEFEELISSAGGESTQDNTQYIDKLNNVYGFNIQYGGIFHYSKNGYEDLDTHGFWWSSTDFSSTSDAKYRLIIRENGNEFRMDYPNKAYYVSVRCVKNI
jgi:uncharacterized protein (TIGR02145 family)